MEFSPVATRLTDDDYELVRRAVVEACSSRPWIIAAWLYGSGVRGGVARDIDVGILAHPIPANLGELSVIALELAMGVSGLLVPFDVRLLNGADPVFLHNVLSEGRLLFERDGIARSEFEARSIAKWLDFAPRWEAMRRAVLVRWSRG